MTAESHDQPRYSEEELQRMFARYITHNVQEQNIKLTPEEQALVEQLVEMTKSLEGKTETEQREIGEQMKTLTSKHNPLTRS